MQHYNLYTIQSRERSGANPVTVQQVKDYMRLEGFQDVEDSTPTVFDDDDAEISDMITAAVETLEKRYGISIVEQEITATITNLAGMIEIPLGPLDETSVAILDENGEEVDDVKLIGTKYPKIKCPQYENMTVTYTAGYEEVPKKIKNEILRMVAWMYSHRGEEDGLKGFQYTTNEYNRNSWLL